MRFTGPSVLIIATLAFQDYFASAHAHDESKAQHLRQTSTVRTVNGSRDEKLRSTTRRVRRLRGNVKPKRERQLKSVGIHKNPNLFQHAIQIASASAASNLDMDTHTSTKAPSTKAPSTKAPTTSTKAPTTSTKAPTTSTKAPTAPTCTLKAHLGFPLWQDPDDAPYFGINSDLLKVSYSDLDFCTAYWTLQPWCTYSNTNISGEGKGATIRNDDDYYGESELDHVQEETIEITGAAGKTTTFTVSHQNIDPYIYYLPIIYYGSDEYNDHMLTATLTITNESKESVGISDEQGNGAWRYPTKGDVPPELENGDANPAFVGEFSIYVTCDNQCDCEAHDYTVPSDAPTPSPTDSPTLSPTTSSPTTSPTLSPTDSPTSSPTNSPSSSPTSSPTVSPTDSLTDSPTSPIVTSCTLVAELGYPGWEDPDDATYMGYNYDWLAVGYSDVDYCDAWTSQPWCSYENTNATGTGAYIGNVDDYYDDWAEKEDKLSSEKFTITSAADKTTYFQVKHAFNEEDWYYQYDCWSDHMFAATLSISNEETGEMVSDEDGEEGWHYPVDKDTLTHIKVDGKDVPNPEYGGEFEIAVTCDNSCECYAHDYTTDL